MKLKKKNINIQNIELPDYLHHFEYLNEDMKCYVCLGIVYRPY